jgi:hypothetical protein
MSLATIQWVLAGFTPAAHVDAMEMFLKEAWKTRPSAAV